MTMDSVAGGVGDAATLERLGAERGFRVHVVPAVEGRDGKPVSSTAIRRAIAAGDLTSAADGLGRRYAVSGQVQRGAGRGATIGFPTLNVGFPGLLKLLPPDGVYAVEVVSDGERFGGMVNLGPRPTVGDETRSLEAHLFGADGDWYGRQVRVELVARFRDVARFDGLPALKAQLYRDKETAGLLLARNRAGY